MYPNSNLSSMCVCYIFNIIGVYNRSRKATKYIYTRTPLENSSNVVKLKYFDSMLFKMFTSFHCYIIHMLFHYMHL